MFLRVWQRGFAEPGTILTLGVLTLMIVGTLIGSVYIKEPTSTSTKAAICDSYGNCCATEGEFCGQGGHTCCQHPTVSEPLYCGTDYLCKRTSGGCSKDSDCSTNYCENGTCQPKKNNGESCTRNEACFYGICLNSVCVAPSPVPTRTPTPIPTITPTKSPDCAAENEYCGQGGKSCCASFVCTNSVCKRSNTSICSLDSHCATGYCINGSCQQKLSNGSTCSIDANCISNICVQNLCQNKMADYQPCSIGYHCQSGHCGLSPAGYICLPATSPASPAPTPITANPDACAINPSSPECIASTLQTSTNQYACYTAPTSPECQAYQNQVAATYMASLSEWERTALEACQSDINSKQCQEYFESQKTKAAVLYSVLGVGAVSPSAIAAWNALNFMDDFSATLQCALTKDHRICSMVAGILLNPVPGASLTDNLKDVYRSFDQSLTRNINNIFDGFNFNWGPSVNTTYDSLALDYSALTGFSLFRPEHTQTLLDFGYPSPVHTFNGGMLMNPSADPFLNNTIGLINDYRPSTTQHDPISYWELSITRWSENFPNITERSPSSTELIQSSKQQKIWIDAGEYLKACGDSPMCWETHTALHMAGAEAGYASEVVSAWKPVKGKAGHTWIEFEHLNQRYVADPIHFDDGVRKAEEARLFYEHFLGLDMSTIKTLQYAIP
jgi:hypothetical protein